MIWKSKATLQMAKKTFFMLILIKFLSTHVILQGDGN